jgi:hypothetical protein
MKLAQTTMLALTLLTGLAIPEAKAAKIQDLAWLTGHWTGTYQGLPMEAHYGDSSGGMILGMTKIASSAKAEFFEFEKIAEEGQSLVLRPFPFGKGGVPFSLKEMTASTVVFENPSHDFPTRIIYQLTPNGGLVARIEGMQNGQPASDEFVFKKVEI